MSYTSTIAKCLPPTRRAHSPDSGLCCRSAYRHDDHHASASCDHQNELRCTQFENNAWVEFLKDFENFKSMRVLWLGTVLNIHSNRAILHTAQSTTHHPL